MIWYICVYVRQVYTTYYYIYDMVYVCVYVRQVYMMTWVERKMAAALFAVPPSATVDEALSHFMQVCVSLPDATHITVWSHCLVNSRFLLYMIRDAALSCFIMSQLNLPHGTNTKKWKTEKLKKGNAQKYW